MAASVCAGGAQNVCVGGPRNGLPCFNSADCPMGWDGECVSGTCAGGPQNGNPCLDDADCNPVDCVNAGYSCTTHEDCTTKTCVGAINTGDLCADNGDCECSPVPGIPVVAGLPIVYPLYPVNFAAAPCMAGDPPRPLTAIVSVCVGGADDGKLCNPHLPSPCATGGICTDNGVWVDRIGTIWAVEQEDAVTGDASAAAILLFENWSADRGCQPWRTYAPPNGPGQRSLRRKQRRLRGRRMPDRRRLRSGGVRQTLSDHLSPQLAFHGVHLARRADLPASGVDRADRGGSDRPVRKGQDPA